MNIQCSTRRLVLRPLRRTDYARWEKAYAAITKKQNKYDASLRDPSRRTRAAFNALVRGQEELLRAGKQYAFGIFKKASGEYIGGVALMDITRQVFQNAYIGWHLLNPHWGHGYGKEACAACIKFAFKNLHLHRVEAGINLDNARSLALARSLNMRNEGVSRKRLYLGGTWNDLRLYAITAEDLGLRPRRPGEASVAGKKRRAVRRA